MHSGRGGIGRPIASSLNEGQLRRERLLGHDRSRIYILEEIAMRTTSSVIAVSATALLALAACNKASNPSDMGSTPPPTADQGATGTTSDQSQVAANTGDQATGSTQASSNYDAAVSKAQSDNRDALAKCDTMSGDAAKTCRDQANAALKSAMDQAEAARTNGSPQG